MTTTEAMTQQAAISLRYQHTGLEPQLVDTAIVHDLRLVDDRMSLLVDTFCAQRPKMCFAKQRWALTGAHPTLFKHSLGSQRFIPTFVSADTNRRMPYDIASDLNASLTCELVSVTDRDGVVHVNEPDEQP